MKKNISKINNGWNLIFKEYDILNSIEKFGFLNITSEQMNDVPTKVNARLLAKIDSREQLPTIFKDNNLGILSINNGTYKIYKNNGNDQFFDLDESNVEVIYKNIPLIKPRMDLLNEDNITSESKAIDFTFDSDIFNDLFKDDFRLAKRDRERVSNISFKISDVDFNVSGTQIEIDGCYEGAENVLIIEGKNCSINNLTIRQILYPYLAIKEQTNKNVIFALLEYNQKNFKLYLLDINENNQIKLLKVFVLNFTRGKIKEKPKFLPSDVNETNLDAPFPQANNFYTVLNLFFFIYNTPNIHDKVSLYVESNFSHEFRQLDYYLNVLLWMKLIKIVDNKIQKTEKGLQIFNMKQNNRNITLANIIFSHPTCKKILLDKKITKKDIELAQNKRKIGIGTFNRRKSTIYNWIIFFKNIKII